MMERDALQSDSTAFYIQSWAAFLLAVSAMAYGIWAMPLEPWTRGFLAVGYLFTISTCITLSKVVRDRHEHQRLINRISTAATEKILREHEVDRAA